MLLRGEICEIIVFILRVSLNRILPAKFFVRRVVFKINLIMRELLLIRYIYTATLLTFYYEIKKLTSRISFKIHIYTLRDRAKYAADKIGIRVAKNGNRILILKSRNGKVEFTRADRWL